MASVGRNTSPRPRRPAKGVIVEPVGADLVALAQAHALDASTFPHASLPPVFGVDAPPAVWVARRGRFAPVVGFLATRPTKSALEICGLAVEAEHRRAGIARALVRAAVRSARTRGYDALELHVATGNLAAVLLYESERFVKASLIDGFYASARAPSGGDAWRMVRELH